MIKITQKKDCCGCEACRQVCPRQCITMASDAEGFLYPVVDSSKCVDCGMCEKVCPVISQAEARRPITAFAAKHSDEQVRKDSSSGGAFTAIAKSVIARRGVVFGAAFDSHWGVEHRCADTVNGIVAFRGSKYVQSRIGEAFRSAKRELDEGRVVLFSGTPCQIAGLRRFLRKDYQRLLTVEVVCHGVPSSMIWADYLSYLSSGDKVVSVDFRNKAKGWKMFGIKVVLSNNGEYYSSLLKDLYMQGFLQNIYLRPSCYDCPAKSGKSGSDIALADFWGIEQVCPHIDDDKGVSLAMAYTQKGLKAIEEAGLSLVETDFDVACRLNPAIDHSVDEPECRSRFFLDYELNGFSAVERTLRKMRKPLLRRILGKMARIIGIRLHL